MVSDPVLRAVLNVLWIVFGGFLIFLEYLLGGALLCLTIVGIPFGIQCFKLAWLGLLPFGREVVERERASGCLSVGMNVLWLIVAGIWIAISHLVLAFGFAITIIGIPFAFQHIKLAILSLTPFGKEIRLIENPEEWRYRAL